MPVAPTYPGVYVEEIPSGVRTITGVATSITAFIGRALKGPLNEPILVTSFASFDRWFGGLWRESTLSYAVYHFFQNGGSRALVVRVAKNATPTVFTLKPGGDAGEEGENVQPSLSLAAANPGHWGNNLRISVDHETADPDDGKLFNLKIEEMEDGRTKAVEDFLNLSVAEDASRYVGKVLEHRSSLVRIDGDPPESRPAEIPPPAESSGTDTGSGNPSMKEGSDGDPIRHDQIAHPDLAKTRQGLWALDKADLFNLLCIPPYDRETDVVKGTWDAALKYCEDRRAMLILDSPTTWEPKAEGLDVQELEKDSLPSPHKNAAIYFPRLRMADPKQEGRIETFAPCGAVAGIFARTDGERGVWKAPAGQDARLSGVHELSYKLTDDEIGLLNPLGINCLRRLPLAGPVVWGARTLEGADRLASEWKYVPVRRLTLFIEESLYRGTHWVVFEPNDEPLWAQIRLNVGAFMQNLFRQGAFQGSTPRDAYFVKCDKETTTQNDVDLGIVNILVGFAPLKPAEFVILQIQQIAGQITA